MPEIRRPVIVQRLESAGCEAGGVGKRPGRSEEEGDAKPDEQKQGEERQQPTAALGDRVDQVGEQHLQESDGIEEQQDGEKPGQEAVAGE